MKSLKKFISQAIELPANVDMEFNKTYQRGEKLECRLTLKLQESPIEVEQISVALRAEETVAVDGGYRSGTCDKDGNSVTVTVGTVTSNESTFNEEIVVSNAINIEPNKEYSWTAAFAVSKKYNPTYRGIHAHHVWWLSATITLAHRTLIGKKNFSYEWNELIVL